jgi:hypothetical protein
MSDLTNSTVTICDYWKKKIEQNLEELELSAVYYGDQERIAKSPALCIEPDTKASELRAAGRQVMPNWTIYFLLYSADVKNAQWNRRESDRLAELLEAFLNADPQMGGLVVHCWVSESLSGYDRKMGSLMYTNRLTFRANSRFQLPMSS